MKNTRKKQKVNLNLFFDGSCKNVKNQPSKMGVGFCVFEDDKEIFAIGYSPNELGTSNVSEWYGLISALVYLQSNDVSKYDKIIIHSDSRLVVEQFLGNYDITKPHLLELYKTAKQIEPEFKYTLKWIPREQNKRADELSVIGRNS